MNKHKLVRHIARLLCVCLLCLCLSGCWSYRGIEEIAIVAGLAVDESDKEDARYLVTFEMVDMNVSVKDNETKSVLVEGEGQTIYDALGAAQKKLTDRLFYGNMQLLVISHKLAESEGVTGILDSFFRNIEVRETISVIVSGEDTAAQIITPPEGASKIVSNEIKKKLETEKKTSDFLDVNIFEAVGVLKQNDLRLVLPEYRMTGEEEKQEPEIGSLALFTGDRLTERLEEDELRPYLFAVDAIRGGPFVFSAVEGESPDITLTVSKSKTRKSFDNTDGRLTLRLDIQTSATLSEGEEGYAEPDKLKQLGKRASDVLKREVEAVVRRQQTGAALDVFGFEAMLRREKLSLWRELKDDWPAVFREADVVVEAEVTVVSTGFIK